MVHVQAVCRATFLGADGTTDSGIGILEQLAIGPHPTGLTGIFDGYAPVFPFMSPSQHGNRHLGAT
jgi:hypothetical protein